jgi:hypothetical protein
MPPQSFLPSSSVFERASTRSNPALINRMTHTSPTATMRMCATRQGIRATTDQSNGVGNGTGNSPKDRFVRAWFGWHHQSLSGRRSRYRVMESISYRTGLAGFGVKTCNRLFSTGT